MSAWLLADGTVPAGLPVVKSIDLVLLRNPHVTLVACPLRIDVRIQDHRVGMVSRLDGPAIRIADAATANEMEPPFLADAIGRKSGAHRTEPKEQIAPEAPTEHPLEGQSRLRRQRNGERWIREFDEVGQEMRSAREAKDALLCGSETGAVEREGVSGHGEWATVAF